MSISKLTRHKTNFEPLNVSNLGINEDSLIFFLSLVTTWHLNNFSQERMFFGLIILLFNMDNQWKFFI